MHGDILDFVEFRDRDKRRLDDRTEVLAKRVIGAAIEVHRQLGPGMPEISHKRALSYGLELRGILHRTEEAVPISYEENGLAKG